MINFDWTYTDDNNNMKLVAKKNKKNTFMTIH